MRTGSLLAAIVLCLCAAARAEDWPCFQHDPQHSGVTQQQLKLPLKMIWEKQIGWSTSQAIAVAGRLYLGRWDGDVLCLDQKTGNTLWSYQTDGPVLFSACIDGGRVFIGSEDEHIYCLSADGKLLWKHKTGGPIWSSPVAASGLVFCGSKDGRLYTLRESDGSVAWTYSFSSPVWSSPAYHDGKVFCGSQHGRFAALDVASGKELWTFQTHGWMVNNSPTISAGRVYIAALNRAYLPESGEWHVWTQGEDGLKKVLEAQNATPSAYCLDEATGKLLWSFPLPDKPAQAPTTRGAMEVTNAYTFPGETPAVDAGRVFLNACSFPFGDGTRQLVILDAQTGQLAAVSNASVTGLFADPVVAANTLICGDLCLLRGIAHRNADATVANPMALGVAPLVQGSHSANRFMANVSCADGLFFAVGLVRHNAPAGMGYIRAYAAGK